MDFYQEILQINKIYQGFSAEQKTLFDTLLSEILTFKDSRPEGIIRDDSLESVLNILLEGFSKQYLKIWRFICLPEVTFDSFSKQSTYVYSNKRYDTFSPAIKSDRLLRSILSKYIKDIEFYIVVDEWEAPLVRINNEFQLLSKPQKDLLIKHLISERNNLLKWINSLWHAENKEDLYYKFIFLADVINYYEFEASVNSLLKNQRASVLVGNLINFHQSDPNQNQKGIEELKKMSSTLLAQYSLEAILVKQELENSIYLNSEYPTELVYEMLSYYVNQPTLFYISDAKICTLPQ